MKPLHRAFGAALLAAALSPPAMAQTGRESRADMLFREGREALKRGAYGEACTKLAESQKLDPAPGTALNISECEEKRGHLVPSWRWARESLRDLPVGDDRRTIAQARLASLERKLGRIRVVTDPWQKEPSEVRLDGTSLAPTELDAPVAVDPGQHTLTVTWAESGSRSRSITIREGQLLPVELAELRGASNERQSGSAAGTASASPGAAATSTERPSKVLAISLLTVGLAGGVLTGVTLPRLLDDQAKAQQICSVRDVACNTEADDAARSGRRLAPLFYVGAAMAVVGLGAGGYLLFAESGPSTTVSATALPGGGHLTLRGRF